MSKLYGGLSELRNGSMCFDDVLTYYGELPLSAFILKTVNITKKEGNKMARIRNQAILDLRQFTPEALKKIKSIKRVATVILPENMSSEFTEVYAGIKKTWWQRKPLYRQMPAYITEAQFLQKAM